MSDYNRRQYQLMLDQLKLYEQGKMGLNKLIVDLEALLGCLENIEKSWEMNFRKQWGVLEEEYSFFVVEKQKEMKPETQKMIDRAVTGLKNLVMKKLSCEGNSGNTILNCT